MSSTLGTPTPAGIDTTVSPALTRDAAPSAVPRLPARDDALYLRGLGSLRDDYAVRCDSWFCRAHLLGVDLNRQPGPSARAKPRYGTFDAVIVAAEAGNPDAEFMVAEVLAGGHGVRPSPKRAAMWYGRAAQHGNTLAVARLNGLRAALADRE